jgi:hypothetical protein
MPLTFENAQPSGFKEESGAAFVMFPFLESHPFFSTISCKLEVKSKAMAALILLWFFGHICWMFNETKPLFILAIRICSLVKCFSSFLLLLLTTVCLFLTDLQDFFIVDM